MSKSPVKFCGSFAPPLTEEKLVEYGALSVAAGGEIHDAMEQLLACAYTWWNQPESTGNGRPHPSGRGFIVDLDEPIKAALYESIPWTRELDSIALLFESIDPVTAPTLRNACFHLLWFARELDRDREPMTIDKVYTADELARLA